MDDYQLILASASPRRRQLLEYLGVSFRTTPADVDEAVLEGERPTDYVLRLAKLKASTVLASTKQERPLVLGSDTAVVLGEQIFGKPQNIEESVAILLQLSNNWHEVMTGVVLSSQSETRAQLVTSRVKFRTITEAEVHRYWETGEPQDKAGSYGIQERGGAFVERIDGSYSNIVGLPLCETAELLTSFGIKAWSTA